MLYLISLLAMLRAEAEQSSEFLYRPTEVAGIEERDDLSPLKIEILFDKQLEESFEDLDKILEEVKSTVESSVSMKADLEEIPLEDVEECGLNLNLNKAMSGIERNSLIVFLTVSDSGYDFIEPKVCAKDSTGKARVVVLSMVKGLTEEKLEKLLLEEIELLLSENEDSEIRTERKLIFKKKRCRKGYVWRWFKCRRRNKGRVSGCKRYRLFSRRKCRRCHRGWVKIGHKCYKWIAGCKKYNRHGACIRCHIGYKKIGRHCKSTIPNCHKFNHNGTCRVCVKGCVLSHKKCFKIIKHCSKYNKKGGCHTCKKGYFVKGHRCIRNVRHCIKYNHKRHCIRCKGGFRLYRGSCFRYTGCTKFFHGACTGCKHHYFLRWGICCRRVRFCLKYSRHGHCIGCRKGFKLGKRKCHGKWFITPKFKK